MVKIKPVLQHDYKDCGICAMEYIINYYGGYIPLSKLRDDTFTDSKGTTAYHIVNAFKKWGFDSIGVLEHDLNNFKLSYPLIAHLKLKNNLEHFIVIKYLKDNIVYIMDPGSGDKKMSLKDFNTIFTGNIILAKPREKIIKMDKGLTINKIFFKIFFKEKFLILKIIAISLLVTIFSVLTSYYLKIGSTILNEDYNLVKYIIIVFFFIIFLKVFLLYIREYYQNHLNNLIDVYVYPDFLTHLFNLPLNNIKSRTAGEIMARIQELTNIKNLFSEIFTFLFLDLFLIVLSAIFLYFINNKLFIILVVFIVLYTILGLITSKTIYKKISQNINYQTDFNSIVLENISMYESIKNLNLTDKFLDKIENSLARVIYYNYKFNTFINKTNFLKNYLIELCLFLINSYGFINVYKGNLNIIDLFTFNILLSYLLEPIKNIIDIWPKYYYVKACFDKVSEIINIDREDNQSNNLNLDDDIIFQNVSFSYNNYKNVLQNINLTIKKGSKILIDGQSGIGKSTICRLIYKEYNTYHGDILIGGYNIKDITLGDIRENILYISQNELLFTGTIKENIIAYRDVSEKLFKDICDICLIEDIVSQKSLRYNTLIETDALNISGGEAQRIILARGLLKKCNIIILDEALSEVDKEIESKIIKNIINYFKEKTIIYISHKNQAKLFKDKIYLGGNNE